MASVETADFSDIKTAGAGFSFTGNLSKLAVNGEWVDAYNALTDDRLKQSGLSTMWKAVSAGTEEVGGTIYRTIRNYIDDIGNIDTCGLDALKNYAHILGVSNDYLNLNISLPIEVKRMVEIFSVNPAYLYNKSTDGSDGTLVLPNSILHYSTVEQFLFALKDSGKYEELVNSVFFNTIMGFLNLKTTTFDDSAHGTVQTEIWRNEPNRFLNRLWGEDITSDEEIYSLKESLGVNKSFTEKIYADDIIAGRRSMSEFSDVEQSILKAEIKNRETRYGDSNAMRYYYMRLFKVIEYFRFATIAYVNAYELEQYELNVNKYNIVSDSDNRLSLLKFNYSEYEIDESAIRKVAKWLTGMTLGLRKVREYMKTQCRRNMMVGTKRLIVDVIRKFILDKIDGDVFDDVRGSVLHSAGLNRKFGVSIIEYSDMTEYFNIENPNDAVKPSSQGLNERYWEMYDDCGKAFASEDVLSFYNRLFGDSKRFLRNTAEGSDGGSDNLYEFLSLLFESGATATVNSDYYLSSDLYIANGGSDVRQYGSYTLSEEDKSKVAKYAGDMGFGDAPYANHKNRFHPSYQMHPFVQAFEEYNEAYTSVMNLVNAYTADINDSYGRLKDRLDALGNTINFWYNWNDDFSGYSSTYEKSGNDFDVKSAQDGPFNFGALQEFIEHPGEYVNNILNGINPYYKDNATGRVLLTSDDVRLEVARLQKYESAIRDVAGREIYRYGKDYNGNIYILYKSEGCRRKRNALGDIWVRLRNHPIAFPLFDLSLSPVRFNDTSCISESDSTKLLSVLTKMLTFFKESYGMHYGKNNTVKDGSVDMGDVTLYVSTYSETVPVTSDEHNRPSFSFGELTPVSISERGFHTVAVASEEIERFLSSENNVDDMTVYEISAMPSLSGLRETYYFLDTITGEKISGGSSSMYEVSSDDGLEPNPTGCIVSPTDISFFNASYNPSAATFAIDTNMPSYRRRVVFADYEDSNDFDGKNYYCISRITGKQHPCNRRKVMLNKILLLSADALSGAVGSDGTVTFGGSASMDNAAVGKHFTPSMRYELSIDPKPYSTSVLDGGLVYEDFRRFSYYVMKGDRTETVDTSSIVILGGCNPYHITRGASGEIGLEKAYQHGGAEYSDVMVFSDSLYRNKIQSPSVLSSYTFSSCEFLTTYCENEVYRCSDSIGSFYLRGKPYERYQPFTRIYGEPLKVSPASVEPFGKVTIKDVTTGDEAAFYYRLDHVVDGNLSRHVWSKSVGYELSSATVNVTSCKMNGSIELTPYDSTEYPIVLNFSTEGCDNVATYSSFMSEIGQQKFFDMGFSYNQKIFYMSYTNGSGEYLDGGTVVGRLDENYDENYNSTLSFHRDSKHNVEYVDARTSFLSSEGAETFHIGDVSSKRGIFSVYGKYVAGSNDLEVSISLFSEDDVRIQKFGVKVVNGLYEFDSGSKYSLAASCTEDRLYVSFTTNVPGVDDVIGNTISGPTGGTVGSTRFGNVSSGFMDCMVQILSFDITDDEIAYVEDETRFILGGGDIGYFQQFPGMLGKSNIFDNSKISTDFRFPMQPQFTEVCGSPYIEFMRTYESRINGYVEEPNVRTFERYVSLLPYVDATGQDEISGFLTEEGHRYAMFCVASDAAGGKSYEFASFGGRPIIDLTRGLDGGGYGGIVRTYGELWGVGDRTVGDRWMVLEGDIPNSIYEYGGEMDIHTARCEVSGDAVRYAIETPHGDVEIHNGDIVEFIHDLPGELSQGYYSVLIGDYVYDGKGGLSAAVSYIGVDFVAEYENYDAMPSAAEAVGDYDRKYFIRYGANYEQLEVADGDYVRLIRGDDGHTDGVYMLTLTGTVENGAVGVAYSTVNIVPFDVTDGSLWKFCGSRPNHGVNFISDGLNGSNRSAAFVDGATAEHAIDVNGKKLVLIPLHSENRGYTRFDFDELIDRDNEFYSLHSDGRTVSVMAVSSDSGRFNPVSGICEYNFTPRNIVATMEELSGEPPNGTMYSVRDCGGLYEDGTIFRYNAASGDWSPCNPSPISHDSVVTRGYVPVSISVDGYNRSSTIADNGCFAIFDGKLLTWFGAFDSRTVQIQPPTQCLDYEPIPFSVNGIPRVLSPVEVGYSYDFPEGYVLYDDFVMEMNEDGCVWHNTPLHSMKFNRDERLVSVVNTDNSHPSVKMLSTSMGWLYKYDAESGDRTPSYTFDPISAEIGLYRSGNAVTDLKTVISETSNYLLISYSSVARGISGVMRCRKNTPDSNGEPVYFFDTDGNSISPGVITRFLAVDDIVLAEEGDGSRIFISKDINVEDGGKFRLTKPVGDVLHLIGCGVSRFYARYGNGEKVYSTDGETWLNARNIHASNWNVFNAAGVDYIACERFDPDIASGILEMSKYVVVRRQVTVGEGHYDKMRVDSEGNMVCISGMDGANPLAIARCFAGTDDFEVIEFPYVRDMPFSSACVVGEDILLSPDGGMTAVRIVGVFSGNSTPSVEFIDISSALNDEVNVFGGFGYANGRLLMFPSDGDAILVYDSYNATFHRLYSFDREMTLCDCDSIDFFKPSDAILSPRSSSVNGVIKFSRTVFDDRTDYGIFEVDEGYPILVTYSCMETHFNCSDVVGYVRKLTFTMLNDVNRQSISILCQPYSLHTDGDGAVSDVEEWLSQNESLFVSDVVYVVNGRSVRYRIRSVDETPKFVVERIFSDYSLKPSNSSGFVVTLLMRDDTDRASAAMDYELESGQTGAVCVFGSISDANNVYRENLGGGNG